ncbi:MAG: response regulator [Planctomycetes bacterium]|nr:response regulator [Planctomycetota bacterium]
MGSHFLIVEDNPFNLNLLRDLLTFNGHTVESASSVPEARDRLRLHRHDMVLMDIDIPGGGGELVLRGIRADAELAGLPVVAVTGYAMAGDRERLLAAGFDEYVSKPISIRTFLARIETCLKG